MMNTILLIDEQIVNDDDDIICNATERTLEKLGIARIIRVINNIWDTLDYLKFQCCDEQILSPEWIILDDSLTQEECLEFLTAYKHLSFANKDRVLLIHLYDIAKEERNVLKAAGVKEFLSKPVHENELKALHLRYAAGEEERVLRKAS
jgi:response regulator RpfG family c-di-GMP phosphodiesterase